MSCPRVPYAGIAGRRWEQVSFSLVVALATFGAVYVFLIGDWFHRAWATAIGAAVLLVTGVIPPAALTSSIDWNTLALLGGMMVLVGLLGEVGLFDQVALAAARFARGDPRRLVAAFGLASAVISTVIDNVTTILLLGPAMMQSAEALGADPVDLLMVAAVASNLGGLATLVGDPPNILIGTAAPLTFGQFLRHLGPLAGVLLAVLGGWLWWRLPRGASAHGQAVVLPAHPPRPLTWAAPGLVGILGLTLLGLVFQRQLHLAAGAVAAIGAGLGVLWARPSPSRLVHSVDWGTLGFFAGIFVMVGGLERAGAISRFAHWLLTTFGSQGIGLAVLWGSALISAGLDNVPLVAAMIPVVRMINQLHPEYGVGLWMALAAGAAIGGNATVIGASANVVAQGVAYDHGHPMDFMRYFRFGGPVALWTLLAATGYLMLFHGF
ncbi:MAG: tyrosine transporter P-protein [Firmicutes bacterium]|nr:tyrosine transporter P-protein [Bacillota bacterium]